MLNPPSTPQQHYCSLCCHSRCSFRSAIGYEGDGGYQAPGGFGWSWGGGAEGFTVAAADPSRLAFTDTGFFHGSTDGGQSWHALYVKPEERNPVAQRVPPGKAYSSNGLEDTSSWCAHVIVLCLCGAYVWMTCDLPLFELTCSKQRVFLVMNSSWVRVRVGMCTGSIATPCLLASPISGACAQRRAVARGHSTTRGTLSTRCTISSMRTCENVLVAMH